MSEVKNDHINFRMSDTEKKNFYFACDMNLTEPSAILRRMMRDYQTGKISYAVLQTD